MQRIPYISQPVEESLLSGIAENLERYRSSGFSDFADRGDWLIECHAEFDPEPLTQLDDGAGRDAENALRVWQALSNMPPSLACEGRIWTRLCHVECFDYCRARWLMSAGADDEGLTAAVRTHMFAQTMTQRRDDNALSRLWWSAFIAAGISPDGDIAHVLSLMMKTADIRSNFVERAMMMSRPVVAAAVIRVMDEQPEVSAQERTFRDFMIELNRTGGGIVFEYQTEDQVLNFVRASADRVLQAGPPS